MKKKEITEPKNQLRNPVAQIVYDTVLNRVGKDRMAVANELIKKLDGVYNAMVRKAIVVTIAKEQKRIIDALAHDGELVEDVAESVTVKYPREVWDTFTRILDTFAERDAMVELEMTQREHDITNPPK